LIILNNLNISALLRAEQSLQKAIKLLEAVNTDEEELLRDGCIQRFEYTFELCWKTLKKVLSYRGIYASSPREIFRLSAKESLIGDPNIWFSFLEKRNMTTHIYEAGVAEEVYDVIPEFLISLATLINKLKQL